MKRLNFLRFAPCIILLACASTTIARDASPPREAPMLTYTQVKEQKTTPCVTAQPILITDQACRDVCSGCGNSGLVIGTLNPPYFSQEIVTASRGSDTTTASDHYTDADIVQLNYNLKKPERTLDKKYKDGLFNLRDRQSTEIKPPSQKNKRCDKRIIIPLE